MTGSESVLVLVHNTADIERRTNRLQVAGCRQRLSLAAACKLIVYLCVSCMVGERTGSVDTFITMTDPSRSIIHTKVFAASLSDYSVALQGLAGGQERKGTPSTPQV